MIAGMPTAVEASATEGLITHSTFDPKKRLTVEALEHSYLSPYHDPDNGPVIVLEPLVLRVRYIQGPAHHRPIEGCVLPFCCCLILL